ncbi:amino acid permease [Kineosporia sp. NBRC 101731]|uniref:amino acid permease n=1 Tax=Kineosporia sp. NBRC 101731 TaxID=3032199 RepID=UPI0024A3E7EB|nr:amino acid permease [Kineosporia sp. NBRC 101731]GLY31870.1 amino acid permease [Kineosporia sp. NBRC 101731]
MITDKVLARERAAGLGVGQGTALYVGAVLGTGVIALPALAAKAAGPASLIGWLLMVAASAPLAFTFAALGARHPDAGGVAHYARLAFGPRASAVVGWCFYAAVPPGSSAAALFAGYYVESAVGGGRATAIVTAFAMVLTAAGVNWFGVRVSGRAQLALSVLLVGFLLVAVLFALPHADPGHLEPFAPHGFAAIAPATALLVWSFVGWEAITHLTGEFRDPGRDLARATAAAVVIVGVIYLAVALTVILVLGPAAADSAAPLGELLAVAFGGNARVLAAVAAVLLTLGTMNAYYAGAAKLGAALGRDGALPAWLGRGSRAGEVPRRSLAANVVASLTVLGVVSALDLDLGSIVLATSGLFVTVYAVGVAAALRLLEQRVVAGIAMLTVLALLAMTGVHLLWALLVAAAALAYGGWKVPRR